jgi:CIC family chloride channel protein
MNITARRLRLIEQLRLGDTQRALAWAGIVGFLGALCSVLFRQLAVVAQVAMWGWGGDLAYYADSLHWAQKLGVPALGGLAAGLVIRYGSRLAQGQSSMDFMEAVSLGDGTIRVRPSLVKSSASLLSVASGGSIGREGAMAQLSSMLASWIGRWRKLPKPRLQLLVACGAAAGVASAYNAPLAGALFVAEIVLGTISIESLGPLVFASVVSTVTTRELLGQAPLFETPAFELVSPFELGPYLLLGVLLGAAAPWFIRTLRGAEAFFINAVPSVPLRLCAGGAIVGILSLARPEVWGNGNSQIGAILVGDGALALIATVLLFKLAATVACVGSGAVGGVFTPTLFLGASFGALFGTLVKFALGARSAEPSAYALVGMGAFLAGATHAPLTAILMLFEMTLDYGIVLPLMLACVTAHYTAYAISPNSLYTEKLRREKDAHPEENTVEATIQSLVRPNPVTVGPNASFEELVEKFVAHRHNYIYVVDETWRLLGAVALHDIKPNLNRPELARLVIASEIMYPEFPCLPVDAPFGVALERMLAHDGERLPVVDNEQNRVLVGALSKRDVLLTLSLRNSA